MKRDQASNTAAWVAAARSVGALLPAPLQLAQDPFGVRFARGPTGDLARLCLRYPRVGRRLIMGPAPLKNFVLWMQLRTRALDDVLLRFVQTGGQQLVLLGAGYDCRALRFARELSAVRVFEVDHPATQAQKRLLTEGRALPAVRYVSWDFEHQGTRDLPARLQAEGLDPTARTLTIWEGVTMYLTEASIDETVSAVAGLGGPDSWLAVTYLDRAAIDAPRGEAKLTARLVSRVGEPYRFGWQPSAFANWFFARGYQVLSDDTDAQLAQKYWPAPPAVTGFRGQRHVALVRRGS